MGEEQITYHVHEKLLRSTSPFFDAALSKSWQEGNQGRVRLPDDAVEVVNGYSQWLYSRKIDYQHTTDPSSIKDHDDDLPEYFTFAQLYIFGDKIGNIEFKNAVMDEWVNRVYEGIGDTAWYHSEMIINIVYKATTPGSPARKFMVDCYRREGAPDWVSLSTEHQNVEFLVDLTRALLQTQRKPGLPLRKWLKTAASEGWYHEETSNTIV